MRTWTFYAKTGVVAFLPEIPETSKGQVLLVKQDHVVVLSSLTSNQLGASLKKPGKGLLSGHLLSIDEARAPEDRTASNFLDSSHAKSCPGRHGFNCVVLPVAHYNVMRDLVRPLALGLRRESYNSQGDYTAAWSKCSRRRI